MSNGLAAGRGNLGFRINSVLKQANSIDAIATNYAHADNFLFIGCKYKYPMALEGALKLKQISYIHAEGCAGGEMKHGFIAVIDENFPTVCLATRDTTYEKSISNMQEIKSLNGRIIAIATGGDFDIADEAIYTSATLDFLQPIPAVVVLQLLAYYCAMEPACEIDQPRNLATSVTVE